MQEVSTQELQGATKPLSIAAGRAGSAPSPCPGRGSPWLWGEKVSVSDPLKNRRTVIPLDLRSRCQTTRRTQPSVAQQAALACQQQIPPYFAIFKLDCMAIGTDKPVPLQNHHQAEETSLEATRTTPGVSA